MGNRNDSIHVEGQMDNKILRPFGFLEASDTKGNSICKEER